MNTANQVDALIQQWKAEGKSKTFIVWNAALACVGWSYVYSAWGAYCTPTERRKRYNMCKDHPAIKDKCKAFDIGDCSGCQWFPDHQRTRCFDCRGFVDWCLNRIGFDLYGDTCSAQWNHGANWKAHGTINSMPSNVLCCLFVYKDGKWTHTGFGLNNETVECSSGVQYSSKRDKKWTHWAIPAGLDGDIPTPTPSPTPSKPTLRKGSSGEYVTLLQTELINRGYSCGSAGADGKFGSGTEKAVKQFQQDHGLTADGIVGPMTWKALDNAEPVIYYTVIIPHLTQAAANQLLTNYPGSTMKQE